MKDYTENTEAYEFFLKGRYFENKGPFEFEKAIGYMEKAIKADPAYAPAYAVSASIHNVMMFVYSLPPSEMRPKINALRQKALEIDDTYAFAIMDRGHGKMYDFDWKGAESDFKRALELNPGQSDCHHGYAQYLAAVGRLEEGILAIKRSVELNPLSSYHRAVFAWLIAWAERFDQAIEILQETLELDQNNPFALGGLATAYMGKEMYDKAISIMQELRNIPYFEAHLGYTYGKAGKMEKAQEILDPFLKRSKKEYFSPYMIAQVYAGLGEKNKVFEWLDKAYEMRDPFQWTLKPDLFFQSLHSDSRWKEQMKKRGLAN